MIVKQDWLGPYNPVCAEMTVNEYYSYGTLYKTALLPYVVLANRTPPLFTQNTGKRLASRYFIFHSATLNAAQDSHENGVILAVRRVGAAGDHHRARGTTDGAGHSLTGDVGAGLIEYVADLNKRHQQDVGLPEGLF